MHRVAQIGFAMTTAFAMSATAQQTKSAYPETKRIDHVDDYHGTKVADPYRWLEDDVRTSKDVADWVERENKLTFAYLESIPERASIKERLTKLWDYEKLSAPFKEGGRYYYFRNDGLQNQSVLFVQESLDAEPAVLIDPNTWSKDGTVALGGLAFSEDGKYLAYGVNEAGSDWATWRILDIAAQKLLDEEIRWVKYSGATWTKDGKGFFYGRFDEPGKEEAFQSLTLNMKYFYHRAGTPQSEDVLVYQRPDEPAWNFGVEVSDDGRYLLIFASTGTDDRSRVMIKDMSEPLGMPVDLVDNFDNEYTFLGNNGTQFFFKTDLDAPRRRVIAIDLKKPAREHWREIIPQNVNTMQAAGIVGDVLVLSYLKDAVTQVALHTLDGKPLRDVSFPGIGSASGFDGGRSDTETFYTFSSFATPPTVYRYDLLTGESTLLRQAKVDFNPDEYEVRQVFYQSKDGTKVPMFIAHKKGIALNGKNRVLLYGYGGFNISMTPSFSVANLAWMELGGVFAMPNLRGGGEYGEEWHKAGTKLDKQNVFDDFIAAAEWLIQNGYTGPDRLAIHGRSNGGLLVGAAMTQRPELFGAALPGVGVMDMLRFHQFTAGRFWVDDYGSADDPGEFKALLAYSPYHNLREGVDYPPTLVTTADTDDRVVPGHSFKFAAQLQRAQAGQGKTLIRIETRAGHGAGKPTAKVIEEIADQYAFVLHNLKKDE